MSRTLERQAQKCPVKPSCCKHETMKSQSVKILYLRNMCKHCQFFISRTSRIKQILKIRQSQTSKLLENKRGNLPNFSKIEDQSTASKSLAVKIHNFNSIPVWTSQNAQHYNVKSPPFSSGPSESCFSLVTATVTTSANSEEKSLCSLHRNHPTFSGDTSPRDDVKMYKPLSATLSASENNINDKTEKDDGDEYLASILDSKPVFESTVSIRKPENIDIFKNLDIDALDTLNREALVPTEGPEENGMSKKWNFADALKEELKAKIHYTRLLHGKSELQLEPETPKVFQVN